MNNKVSINYQLNDNFSDSIDCPICYETTKKFYKADCNHSWCNDCNNKFSSNLCPLCRKEFRNTKINDFSRSELEYLRIRREIREIIRNRHRRRNRRNNQNLFDKINEFFNYIFCLN